MIPDKIKITVRRLRKNMTKSEKSMWERIKNRKIWVKFQRQKALYLYTENSWLKRYIIPDFYSIEKKLIIEIDGNIHNKDEILKLDKEKEKLIKEKWIDIIRITNEEIDNNIENCLSFIKNFMNIDLNMQPPTLVIKGRNSRMG